MSQPKETKSFPAFGVKLMDEIQGVVEHIVAVMGNVDRGGDIIHPGAFSKSLQERGLKVKVLDQHNASSVRNVVGRPVQLRELSQAELPLELVAQYPDATGALLAQTQFLLETPEGKGVFDRIKAGAVDEYSIGYDPIQADYSTIEVNGKKGTVRNLREVRLWEYSPVVFAMNPATSTLSAKDAPSESKPDPAAYETEAEWMAACVPTRLDEGDEQEQAVAACMSMWREKGTEEPDEKAVMRSEADGQHPASHYLVVEDPEKPSTWHLRVRGTDGEPDHRLMGAAWAALHGGYRGNRYEGPGKSEAIAKLKRLYEQEGMDAPKANEAEHEEKAGRRVRKTKLEEARAAMDVLSAFLKWADYDDEDSTPDEGDEDTRDGKTEKAAGPDLHPRQKQALIDALMLELSLAELEVTE